MTDGTGGKSFRPDDVDLRIISYLQPEGRLAFAEIANRLGVSEGTVRQRYRRLVDSGVLQVVGVADPFRIGFKTMAMIGIKVAIDGDRGVDDVAAEIAQFPEVSYVVMSTGSFDLLVEVIAQDNDEFARFLTDELHGVPGVMSTEAFMLLRVYKMNLGGWRMVQMLKNKQSRSREKEEKSAE